MLSDFLMFEAFVRLTGAKHMLEGFPAEELLFRARLKGRGGRKTLELSNFSSFSHQDENSNLVIVIIVKSVRR